MIIIWKYLYTEQSCNVAKNFGTKGNTNVEFKHPQYSDTTESEPLCEEGLCTCY